MTSNRYHRREFLQRLGMGTLSAFALAGGSAVGTGCTRNRDPLVQALAALFDDSERAGAVGAAYLQQAPAEAGVEPLLTQLFGGAALAEAREQAAADRPALHERLRAVHRDDFAAGRVVDIDGWILSLTEARVCAVVSQGEI